MWCWAAESRVGAVVYIASWILSHVAFGGYAITGRGWFSRESESLLYWIDLGLFGFSLLCFDVWFVVGLLRERRARKMPNQSPEPRR